MISGHPRWYDYAVLPAVLIFCISIPVFGYWLESTRPTSPTALIDDPKANHLRIYQEGQLLGLFKDLHFDDTEWTHVSIENKTNLEIWVFRKYVYGYSNKDQFLQPSKMLLKYAITQYHWYDVRAWSPPENDQYMTLTDSNDDPIRPTSANDEYGSEGVMGYFFDISSYIEAGLISDKNPGLYSFQFVRLGFLNSYSLFRYGRRIVSNFFCLHTLLGFR